MKASYNWRKYTRIGLIAVLVFMAIWALIFGNAPKLQYGLKQIKLLERRYGFTYATPVYHRVKCHMELLTLITVTPGGAFDKAGFKPGDVFPNGPNASTDDLFRQLDKTAGTVIEMEVLPADRFVPDCDFDGTGKTVFRKIVAP